MTRPEPNDMIVEMPGGVNEIIFGNKNASTIQIHESVKEKGFSGRIASESLSRGDLLSLTWDLYHYVEVRPVRGGRLIGPIFFHAIP
jgi:hypothetical protein